MQELPSLDEIALPDWVKYARGNVVRTGNHGVEGVIAGRVGRMIRVKHEWHTTPKAAAAYVPHELLLVRFHDDDDE
jgi:hypothetical protein